MKNLTNVHLVYGGAASGKSAYAEQLCSEFGGRCVYIATMQPFGPDAEQRIQRHHVLRAERGFDTVEHYSDLAALTLPAHYDTALLEDVGNLLSNLLFGDQIPASEVAERAVQGIARLAAQVRHMVVVSNAVFSDGITYERETQEWVAALAGIHRRLMQEGAELQEVICGIPQLPQRAPDCVVPQAARRVLILGGAYQGKSDHAWTSYPKLCEQGYLLNGLHREVVQRLRAGEDMNAWLEELLSRDAWVVTCTDIGCGVVPLDRFEREWREMTGRICHALARRADRVERVSCGLVTALKG